MWDETEKKPGRFLQGIGYLFLLGLTCVVVVAIYDYIDSHGWVPHKKESIITAQDNWFVGERKDCASSPLDDQNARILKKPKGYAIQQINCDTGPERSVSVRFWGRTQQPEYDWVRWRCTRNQDSFTCKQTGGGRVIKDTRSLGEYLRK